MSLTMISVTSCSVGSTYLLMAVHLKNGVPMVSGSAETDPACGALAFERPHSATLPNDPAQLPGGPLAAMKRFGCWPAHRFPVHPNATRDCRQRPGHHGASCSAVSKCSWV